jgi:hypothetical protein
VFPERYELGFCIRLRSLGSDRGPAMGCRTIIKIAINSDANINKGCCRLGYYAV